MKILVSDTSVLIDLERADILAVALGLPHRFVVPDALYEAELKPYGGAALVELGLEIAAMGPDEVTAATQLRRQQAKLSLPDVFALTLAEQRGWTLLAGDGLLREVAKNRKLNCHGTLWIFDEIEQANALEASQLLSCLDRLANHRRCRLPRQEIAQRLKRYGSLG